MRTEEFLDFDTKLSTINRNFAHGLFLSEQFLVDNDELIKSEPETLTSDIFKSNRYRTKFNYKLKNIPNEIIDYQKAAFESFFVFMYSTYELYTENLFHFVGKVLGRTLRKIRNASYLDSIFINHGTLLSSHLNQEDIDTLDYIRLRRNCLVHADGKPSSGLITLITTKGSNLNTYWKTTKIKLNVIDFSSTKIEEFNEREIIDTIMLLRDIVRRIDYAVLSLLNKEDLIDFILISFKIDFRNDIANKPRAVIEKKFITVVKMKLNIDKKDINFARIVFK